MEPAIELCFILIIFPNNTELDNMLGDLHYGEFFFVYKVFLDERSSRLVQLGLLIAMSMVSG